MSYDFCNKFHTLSSNAKSESQLRTDKVTESLKVATFLRHSVEQKQFVKERRISPHTQTQSSQVKDT